MWKFLFLCFIISAPVFSQDIVTSDTSAEFSDTRLSNVPSAHDDQETETLLQNIAKKAGWFPKVKINVAEGIVMIDGKVKEPEHLKWLTETADRLPTVIAVVNRAQTESPSFTDMTPFFKEFKKLETGAKKNLPLIIVGLFMSLFFLFTGFHLYKLLNRLWDHKIQNPFLASTITKLTMIPVWVMFFYMTLLTVGLQGLATTIIGGTGMLGIVIGFAFKGIAENYLSGILLAMRSPFTKGDRIQVDQYEGLVQNLNMRGTTIMDFDGNLILIPNTNIISSVVKNFTANPIKRTSFKVGIGYEDSVKACQEVILEEVRAIPGIKDEPAPSVTVDDMGTSSLNLTVYLWFDSNTCSESNVRSIAIVKVKEALLSRGFSMPDEAREVLFADTLKVQMVKEKAEKKERPVVKDGALDISDHEKDVRKIAAEASLPSQREKDNLLKMH